MDIALNFHLLFLSLLPSFLNRIDKVTPVGSGSPLYQETAGIF